MADSNGQYHGLEYYQPQTDKEVVSTDIHGYPDHGLIPNATGGYPSYHGLSGNHGYSSNHGLSGNHGYSSTAATPSNAYADPVTHEQLPTKTSVWQRTWFLVAVAVLGALAAGLVGGIVGWKVTEAKYATSTSASTSPSETGGNNSSSTSPVASDFGSTAGASKTIRANSGLTAIGWRYGTDFQIRVYYQGPDDLVRFSIYDTVYGNWSLPTAVDLGAMGGTPLAATVIWWQAGVGGNSFLYPQAQLFYFASPNKIMGQNWGQSTTLAGADDSINSYSYTAASTSRLTAFWPSVVIQQSTGSVQDIFFNNVSRYEKPADLSITGSDGTALLALPSTTTHENAELRFFYRRTDGKLYMYDRSSARVVQTTTGTIGFTLPSDAPLAGFATARGDGTTNVSTVLLWQDTSAANASTGGIQYVSLSDNTGWKGPFTDSVFADADSPTQLSCVTAAMTGGDTPYGATVALQPGTDMNRCYFQAGGLLKEVSYDGSSWKALGYITMP